MPARTSRLPSSIARLTESSEAIARISSAIGGFRGPESNGKAVAAGPGVPATAGTTGLVQDWIPSCAGMSGYRRPLKRHLVAALERKDLARLIRAGDVQPKPFKDLAHLGDLLCIRFSELSRTDPE